MNLLALLDELHRRKVHLSLDRGRLVVTPPPAGLPSDLVAPVKATRVQLAWAAVGATTGHQWEACDTCAEPMLVRLTRDRPDRACVVTPACRGRVRRSSPRRRTPA